MSDGNRFGNDIMFMYYVGEATAENAVVTVTCAQRRYILVIFAEKVFYPAQRRQRETSVTARAAIIACRSRACCLFGSSTRPAMAREGGVTSLSSPALQPVVVLSAVAGTARDAAAVTAAL